MFTPKDACVFSRRLGGCGEGVGREGCDGGGEGGMGREKNYANHF